MTPKNAVYDKDLDTDPIITETTTTMEEPGENCLLALLRMPRRSVEVTPNTATGPLLA